MAEDDEDATGAFDGIDKFKIPDDWVENAPINEPPQEVRNMAATTFMLFSSLVDAGFSRDEAIRLIAEMMKGNK